MAPFLPVKLWPEPWKELFRKELWPFTGPFRPVSERPPNPLELLAKVVRPKVVELLL
jgi:hypothetical protein